MTARNLLHRSKLEAFAQWCEGMGYGVERKQTTLDSYEVLRVRVPGRKCPAFVYDRHDGDHLTVFKESEGLVRRFIRAEKRGDAA